MTCYSPLSAYQLYDDKSISFKLPSRPYKPLQLPCGQCTGCRLARSGQWAARCVHEAKLHKSNSFITLTYNDEYLPWDKSLNLKHWQDFMKRLRKKYGNGIRFYHAGEYGEQFRRPHYHAILFNHDFNDKKLWQVQNGQKIYTSPNLEKLWPYGFSTVGSVTFESCAYVARYVMKKINGKLKEEHYRTYMPDTGEIIDLKPEYSTMSRRPGIGKKYFDKYYTDMYPSDNVVINGRKLPPPKYYDRQYELLNPDQMALIKKRREKAMKKFMLTAPDDYLYNKKTIVEQKVKRLKRNI